MMTDKKRVNSIPLDSLEDMATATAALYQEMMDTWADLKAIQMDWQDEIMRNRNFTAFESYLDLCHMLYELRSNADHIENAYESALDAIARIKAN